MAARRLPDMTPEQVERLQDALLANADALLVEASEVVKRGLPALARSLAILGMEESGKAIAIHQRRVRMPSLDEGTPFRSDELDGLWANHQKKLTWSTSSCATRTTGLALNLPTLTRTR